MKTEVMRKEVENKESGAEGLRFSHLPGFAQFLLEHKLDDFVKKQLEISREVKIPLLKILEDMPDEQLWQISKDTTVELLSYASKNNLEEQIAKALKLWTKNLLPFITREQIVTEDITLASLVRKRAMLYFLPDYTRDFDKALSLVDEVDKYIQASEAAFFRTYVNIQQRELEEEKRLAEAITDSSVDVIGVYDTELRLLACNKKFEEQFKVKKENVLGKPILEIFPYLKGTDIITDLHRALRGEVVHYPDRKFMYVDQYYESFVLPMRNRSGRIFAALALVHDITEIKKTAIQLNELNKALADSNQKLRNVEDRYQRMVLEVEDYAILRLSPDGIVENWNKGAEKIKGYKAEEIIGKSFKTFYPAEDVAAGLPDKILAQAKATGRATTEGWRVRKDGSRFWGSIAISALHNEKNEVVGFTKVTRDLTERKMAEAQLEKKSKELAIVNRELELKNTELERSNKELNSFSYVASHDLQEPLRKIMMFAQMLAEREGEKLSPRSREMFAKIQAGAVNMKRLIEDLLAFSRLQSYSQHWEFVNLNGIVKELKESYADTQAELPLTILSDQLPTVNGISFQLSQLFENIIGNAVKYAKADVPPKVEISSQIVDGAEIKHEDVPGNTAFYKMVFKDNGIGFEQQYAEKIFEIFQRLHKREEYLGTGIGLAICKRIVENHKGFIEAKGQPGVGATIIVYLPV